MFEKLVLSSKAKRQGRTGRFFLLTTMFYSFVVVSALVVSVVAANPAIFEKSDVTHIVAVPPPPLPPKGRAPVQEANSNPAPQPNPYKVATLDQITHPESNPNMIKAGINLPTNTIIGDAGSEGIGDPNGVLYGDPDGRGIGVPTGVPHGEEITPPPPAPKPKPEPPPQAKEPENKIVRVASSILTGKALTRKTPDYPAIAKQIRLEGSIVVEIVISPEGRVESARALGGHPLLTKAAVDAAYGWRFEPTILNGTTVRVTGVITFNFRIN
ncbi:MAG: energy transducer TonB [Acidobacteriota bacterium]